MMRVVLHNKNKVTFTLPTPLTSYETTFLWSGPICCNPHEKKAYRYYGNGTYMHIEEIEYPKHLSRIDNMETVAYTLYSVTPRIWSENDDLFVECV